MYAFYVRKILLNIFKMPQYSTQHQAKLCSSRMQTDTTSPIPRPPTAPAEVPTV